MPGAQMIYCVERLLRVRLTGGGGPGLHLFFFFFYRCRCSFDASEKHSRPIMIHGDEFGSRVAPQAVLRLIINHVDDSLELV